jgi:hypothetical protein
MVLITPDGSNHLLYEHNGRFLQLRVRGVILSAPVHLLAEALIAPELLKSRLSAQEAFNCLCHGGPIPRRLVPVATGSHRLRLVLRALDGRLAGASYREIAVALFGPRRVENDWSDGSDHLKNRIRRAVARGEALMGGGYRTFLGDRVSTHGSGSR